LLLGQIEEDPNAKWTADGRPLTREHASQRLARQICSDASELSSHDLVRMAATVRAEQLKRLSGSIESATGGERRQFAITSGAGEFLAHAALAEMGFTGSRISLAQVAGIESSRSGPAYGLAVLSEELS